MQRAIADAARRTTVDFDYLLAQAEVESSMNPEARARTSSASGLYQFIESTWLETVKRYGQRFGLGEISAQVGDPTQRQAILALRNDPQIASLMAAGLAEDNRAHLTPILGRQPDHGEMYLAHFLGAGGAGRFLSELSRDPSQSAAELFRAPAAANRAIFYNGNGSPRSLADVMHVIDGKMRGALARADGANTSPPYIAANEAVFGPTSPPTITYRSRSAGRSTGITSAPAARPAPMSNVLRATFSDGNQPLSAEGTAQVKRAYDRLKALGL